MAKRETTGRFSSRIDDYVRYRPTYPPAVYDVLRRRLNLSHDWTIADIGSGTGISSDLFLPHGHRVFAVEPNHPMRQAAEARLGGHTGFISIDGTAESTGLSNAAVDLVVAGQAFHWFNVDLAQQEFVRITRPPHRVALFWNRRLTRGSAFLEAYEALILRHGTDYASVRHENVNRDVLTAFFGNCDFTNDAIEHDVPHDLEGLRGRLRSSSYVPAEGEPNHNAMMQELAELFATHAQAGHIVIRYAVDIYTGTIAATPAASRRRS